MPRNTSGANGCPFSIRLIELAEQAARRRDPDLECLAIRASRMKAHRYVNSLSALLLLALVFVGCVTSHQNGQSGAGTKNRGSTGDKWITVEISDIPIPIPLP